ncbi:MAG: type II restriction endonuclease [Rhodobacteraceae bacterium]|nr:type II restriction endonuclease [Paracoccaceae bacterium]
MDLIDWLDDHSEGWFWYVKRLSGNDTLANGSHQAGPYIPRAVFFRLFPSLKTHTHDNAKAWFDLTIASHPDARQVRVIWYNNKWRGRTRDEVRVTNLGGAQSALLDPESTGALAVFAFRQSEGSDTDHCCVWVCRDQVEADIAERMVGPVEPGHWAMFPPDGDLLSLLATPARTDCRLAHHALPPKWLKRFPTGAEIMREVISLRPDSELAVDKRLMRRLDCEFELFQSLEEAVELPRVRKGFTAIADFLVAAQTVLQRRRARAGRALELHMREILKEEGFVEGRDFTWQPKKAEGNPDFVFPNEDLYLDDKHPREQFRMLAAKTTIRDRWRQVTQECPDLPKRHLLTLQEGVSEKQFDLITKERICLVVPDRQISKYANSIRPHLMTVESFMADLRTLSPPGP